MLHRIQIAILTLAVAISTIVWAGAAPIGMSASLVQAASDDHHHHGHSHDDESAEMEGLVASLETNLLLHDHFNKHNPTDHSHEMPGLTLINASSSSSPIERWALPPNHIADCKLCSRLERPPRAIPFV